MEIVFESIFFLFFAIFFAILLYSGTFLFTMLWFSREFFFRQIAPFDKWHFLRAVNHFFYIFFLWFLKYVFLFLAKFSYYGTFFLIRIVFQIAQLTRHFLREIIFFFSSKFVDLSLAIMLPVDHAVFHINFPFYLEEITLQNSEK